MLQRMQKEQDLVQAEERIKRLREKLALFEESFEVITKRPLMKSELDSPELHAEKKVRIEAVSDNRQAINAKRSAENILTKLCCYPYETVLQVLRLLLAYASWDF